jgi:hypothetical protein
MGQAQESTEPVYDAETLTWIARIYQRGGGFLSNSKAIADAGIRALKTRTYNSKIIYWLPFLGNGITAACVPLRDRLGVGIATNTGFVNADFNQSAGLQGNGSKYLNSLIFPSQLSALNNGGLGWWENKMNTTGNVEPIGAYGETGGDERFILDIRSTNYTVWWGSNTSPAGVATAPANGHYYGQRSSATLREMYLGGQLKASSTVSDAATHSNQQTILVCGANEVSPAGWPGRGATAYLTDGTMSSVEIDDFHNLLRTYLIGPTGRPS